MSAHILIVDDDNRITSALRRTLAYEGYQVSTAANGEAALALARTKPPELVILDLMLPGIDGFEVCRRLRTSGDGVAVLMLTARDAVADRVAGLETGADDYLVKPFASEELLARVKALLRRRSPPDVTHEVLDDHLRLLASTSGSPDSNNLSQASLDSPDPNLAPWDAKAARTILQQYNLSPATSPASMYSTITYQGQHVRVYTVISNPCSIHIVQAARSEQDIGQSLSNLRLLLLQGGALVLAFAFVGGWLMTWGLAIVQSIVQEHQGTIELESMPGKGSTFTVKLPMADL